MQSRSRGICSATGPANNHRFHQPNWRKMTSRSGGGLCKISPAISNGLDAATCSAAVTPMLVPNNTIGAVVCAVLSSGFDDDPLGTSDSTALLLAACRFNTSNAATDAGPIRANRAGPVLPPNPG